MELTIKIEDPEFEKSIVDGVNNIKDDKLVEIVCKCVEAYLTNERNIEKLVMYKPYYSDQYKPSEWFARIFDVYEGKVVDDMKDKIIKYLSDNYPTLVFNALITALSEQLLRTDFKASLNDQMVAIANEVANNRG